MRFDMTGSSQSYVGYNCHTCGLTEVLLSCVQCPIRVKMSPIYIGTKIDAEREETKNEEEQEGRFRPIFSGFLSDLGVFVV